MALYAILPEILDIQFIRGDEFGMLLDFDMDLSSHTISTNIYEVGVVVGGVVTAGPSFGSFTITNVDLPAGKINLSLQESQTQSLNPTKQYRWFLRWVAPGVVTRTILSGAISFGDP